MRGALLSALVASSLAGCYRPHIGNGAFVCGPGGSCPDGYACNQGLMLCESKHGQSFDLGASGALFTGSLGAPQVSGVGTLLANAHSGELDLVDTMGTMTPVVPAGSTGWVRLAQPDGAPFVSIWSFSAFTLPSAVTIKPSSQSGDDVIVFATSGSMELDGSVDWRGYGGTGGMAGQPGSERVAAPPTIHGGQPGLDNGGGGGGGYGTDGEDGAGEDGGEGGMAFGTTNVSPILVGAGGGGGGGVGGSGGLAGGAVAFIALGTLTLSNLNGSSAAASINVSGEPGLFANPSTSGGGGGGGSGGSLILSGSQVSLRSGYALHADGGSGGMAGTSGTAGGNGAPGRIWIGGALSADSMPATPAPVLSSDQLLSIPTT